MIFAYEAYDKSGIIRKGVVESSSIEDATELL